ncbi:MAG: RluA family pseudouridine synthase [Planctomycetota bacterium]|jgi:23S rRNA pseudouridine1911/1915/1917 synthase
MDDVPARMDFDQAERRAFSVAESDVGERLDRFLAPRLEEFSRAGVQRLIKLGAVRIGGAAAKAATRLRAGDRIEVDVPVLREAAADPQDLPLTILHEEDGFVVIDKAPGVAVHPGRGRPDGTIANAIAHRYGGGGPAHRPGIVHRLDLDTSGVMVIARTEPAHAALSDAFKHRATKKEYRAIVYGAPDHDEDEIDLPLGRDANRPEKMAVRFDNGREALTRVEVLERFGDVAGYVLCRPHTGRTHQIRVHLATRGHPLFGDTAYAGRRNPPIEVPRLMLHASRLAFPHPDTGEEVVFEAELPEDFRAVLARLRALGE